MRAIIVLSCLALRAWAATSISDIQVTNTQAVVHISTDQAGNCTYRISESPTLMPLVHDVDPLLFTGANSDARPGSIIKGVADHWFTAGARTSAKAVDGKFYSRALAAYTQHWGGATCGSDAEVTFTFTTTNILTGNTFADPVPFDSSALGNYALPTVNYSDLSTDYVDPQTGLKFRVATGPGQNTDGTWVSTGSLATTFSPGNIDGEVLASNNWSNPTGCLANKGACTYTASAQDVLFLRLAATSNFGGEGGFYGWQNMIGSTNQFHAQGIDAIQLNLTGNGGGSTIQVDAALSWNGVDQASEWKTITLPASSGTVNYPTAYSALLAAWQGPNYPLVPGVLFERLQTNFPVKTSGSVVTTAQVCNQYGQGGCFPLDPRIFKAGSKVTITGAEFTVAAVDSATQITVTGTPTCANPCTIYISNFGVMVRKHTASAGTVNLTKVTTTVATSGTWNNAASGFQQLCSPQSSTDSGGHVGHLCLVPGWSNGAGIFWITEDLQARYIGRGYLPAGTTGLSGDRYNATLYFGQSLFDATDANSWYISTTLTSNGHPTLMKATYTPGGAAGCTVPHDYAAFPTPGDWSNNLDNCNITYRQITAPSAGRDIYSQLNPILQSGKFPAPGLSFVQNGKAVLVAANGQDGEAWYVLVDLSTGLVTGQFSTYMNSAEASCRFCVLHGPLPSSASDSYFGMFFNRYAFGGATGGTTSGDGPYLLKVSTALTTTPSNRSCTGVTDPAVTWLIPYSDGCDDITLAGADNIPCDPDPSTWETSHMPACSWGAGTQFQGGAIKVGDWIQDVGTGYEIMVIAKHGAGSNWTVIRNIDPPNYVRMKQAGFSPGYLRNHSANWTAAMQCTFSGNAFASTSEVDGSTLLWDREFLTFNHAVLRHSGIAEAAIFFDAPGSPSGLSVKTGQYPGIQNQPENYRLLTNPTFAGKAGVAIGQYLQSHAGWLNGSSSLVDMSPLAPGGGGSFSLWAQAGVTQVTGTLYKIPAANAYIAPDKRRRALMVWSGMWNMKDVSGAGIDGTSAHNWHYCSIDYVGATCGQANEVVGDVFVNIPQITIDGSTGGAYDLNRPNVAPIGMETLAVMQYQLDSSLLSSDGMAENRGRKARRLTAALARYGGQDTYSNAKIIEGSNILTFTCSTPNLQRVEDLCIAKMPIDAPAEIGNDFLSVPAAVPGGHAYAEAQFGYAEFGAADSFYCTTRQEACNTSSPAGTPFNWEGETRRLTACSTGCSVKVPVLPDHVVYYRTRTSDNGTTWSNGPIQVAVAPGAAGPNCVDLTFSPTSSSSPAAGGSGAISVRVTDQACGWTTSSSAGWLTIGSGSSGTGNGTINWSAAANNGAQRNAAIRAGSAVFTLSQAQGQGVSCTYSIDPAGLAFTTVGGPRNVAITTNDPSCGWTATSPADWVTVSPGSGTGSGSVTVTAAGNIGSSRNATLTIASQSFAVTQTGLTLLGGGGATIGSGTTLRGVSVQ